MTDQGTREADAYVYQTALTELALRALGYVGGMVGSVAVLNEDMQRLEGEGWLNDTIVETGLRCIPLV